MARKNKASRIPERISADKARKALIWAIPLTLLAVVLMTTLVRLGLDALLKAIA